MLVICRPEMPDGAPLQSTTLTSWTNVEDVIDADLVGDNFRRIYTAVNGGLTAQNLNPYGVDIDEKKVQFPEYVRERQPNVGHTHSHNGQDSSFLGMGAVDRSVTERRSLGAYMFPSNDRPLFTYFGVVPVLTNYPVATDADSGERTFYVDIPYDSVRLPKVWWTSAVQRRAFATLQVLNPVLRPYLAIQDFIVTAQYDDEGNGAMYLRATMQIRGSTAAIESTDGVFLHWTLMVQARPEA